MHSFLVSNGQSVLSLGFGSFGFGVGHFVGKYANSPCGASSVSSLLLVGPSLSSDSRNDVNIAKLLKKIPNHFVDKYRMSKMYVDRKYVCQQEYSYQRKIVVVTCI